MRCRAPTALGVVALALLTGLAPRLACAEREAPLRVAHRLRDAGKDREALRAYLQIPGAAFHASQLARASKSDLLFETRSLLAARPAPAVRRRALLVQGDLLLGRGQREAALTCYEQAAGAYPVAGEVVTAPKAGEHGALVPTAYPVDLPADVIRHEQDMTLPAFSRGPGSHRDNWLLRRFLTLEAWPQAAKEFRRIWEFHVATSGSGPYGALGMQFALDFAYFLKQRDEDARARALLLDVLLRVDLDRAPPMPRYKVQREQILVARGRGISTAGIARKEFVRLVHGEFKVAGREQELTARLSQQVAGGSLTAGRVLARLHLQSGRTKEALQAELAYIDARAFDALSAATRRGRIYEQHKLLRQAVTAYEQAAGHPPTKVDLPDPDESNPRAYSAYPFHVGRRRSAKHARLDLLKRLERLHTGLGHVEVALGYALRQLQLGADPRPRLRTLADGLERFRVGGQETAYREWLGTLASEAPHVDTRANAAFVLRDVPLLQRTLEGASLTLGARGQRDWLTRLRSLDEAAYRAMRDAWAQVLRNGDVRLQRLHETGQLHGAEAARLFEDLLAGRAQIEFRRVRARWSPERLVGWDDVAYRLARLYERAGDTRALQALALRIAREEGPLQVSADRHLAYRDGNGSPERYRAVLAIAIQKASSDEFLTRLRAALADSPWKAAVHQIDRRRADTWPATDPGVAFPWANLPDNLELLACNEDVLCLAADERRVYAGHPWGVAIYDLSGQPLVRVALGTTANSLACGAGALWVATPLGLMRVELSGDPGVPGSRYAVERLLGDQDLEPLRGREPRDPFQTHTVHSVVFHRGRVWFGTKRDMRSLDPGSRTLRIFTPEELEVQRPREWRRCFVAGGELWASRRAGGARRYDAETDRWRAPRLAGRPVEIDILGESAGVLWGQVYVREVKWQRPCRVVLGSAGDAARVEALVVEPRVRERRPVRPQYWSLIGTWRDRVLFGSRDAYFYLDPDRGTLRPLPADADLASIKSLVPAGFHPSRTTPEGTGQIRGEAQTSDGHVRLARIKTRAWTRLQLPGGTLVFGCRATAVQHARSHADHGGDQENRRQGSRTSGGLWFLRADSSAERASWRAPSRSLPSDRVGAVAIERKGPAALRYWVATTAGLSVLDSGFHVRATLGRGEGLVSDRFDAALALGGRLYFGSRWGDSGGGLTVFDPATRVFTSLHPADGLDTNKIASLGSRGRLLEITYGEEFRRYVDGGPQRLAYPMGTLDPEAGVFSSGGAPQPVKAHTLRGLPRRRIPWLGGFENSRIHGEGTRFISTTHGLLIVRGDEIPRQQRSLLDVTLASGQAFERQLAARRMQIRIRTPEDLSAFMRSDNPFVRARALEAASRHWRHTTAAWARAVGVVGEDDPVAVRRAAARMLSKVVAPEARAKLDGMQSDPDEIVRRRAALGLARNGGLPDLDVAEEILADRDGSSSGPAFQLHSALAAMPTPEVTRLLLRHPLHVDSYTPRLEVMTRMGEAVVAFPESVQLLLRARRLEGIQGDAPAYAQRVLGGGGTALLPALHAALGSNDRVVRSNAGRALGYIADPSSIAPLITALEPESGLSRASAVWALGRLRARQALPKLVAIYTDARADHMRRAGAGYRHSQAIAALRTAYDTLSSLDALGKDWSELKQPPAQPVHPLGEPLLTPALVLEAVARIGGGAAQEFYRRVAAESDQAARQEAARQLAKGSKADLRANVAVLRSLRASDDVDLGVVATISLWMLEQPEDCGASIASWLDASASRRRGATLRDLHRARAQSVELIGPFREHLQAIADDPVLDETTRSRARELLKR